MKIRYSILSILTILVSVTATSQPKYVSPVTFPLLLAGNVGELRTDAFHAGIDIKGMQGIGSPVLAVADGHVSRIGVSPWGYGNVLYVTHGDGAMSVYAHLDGFVPEIAKWVRVQQYAKKSFAVDLYPSATQFPVKQGKQIAMVGNTGNSGGAHVHFEIRSPRTGFPINIISEKIFDISDREKPTLKSIKLYEIDTLNGIEIHRLKRSATPSDTLNFRLRNRGYLAYEVVDYKDGKSNTMGIYSIEQRVGGDVNFSFQQDFVDFNKGRYMNAFVEYAAHRASKLDVIRAFVSPNNGLAIYKNVKNRGVITATDIPQVVQTTIMDDAGNVRQAKFIISKDQTPSLPLSCDQNQKTIFWNRDFNHRFSDAAITISKGSLYEDAIMEFDAKGELYVVGDADIALQKAAWLSLAVQSGVNTNKVGIVSLGKNNKISWIGGQFKDGRVSAAIKRLGNYAISQDTVPPKILPQSLAEKGGSQLRFRITDDLSGISTYTLTIDGAWELAELDGKTGTLVHKIKRNSTPVNHLVELVITDSRNNMTKFKKTIQW